MLPELLFSHYFHLLIAKSKRFVGLGKKYKPLKLPFLALFAIGIFGRSVEIFNILSVLFFVQPYPFPFAPKDF